MTGTVFDKRLNAAYSNKAILEKLAEICDACVQYPDKGTKQ